MEISRDQASDLQPDGIAGQSVLPDLQFPRLHIFGNPDDHPVRTAEQNRSYDSVEHSHRQTRAHGAQLCSAKLDFSAWERCIGKGGIDPGRVRNG
jgi:hypothetical protein